MAMRPTSEAPANSPPACIDEVEPNAIPVAPVFGILFALSFAHLVNDTLQSLIPAIYPILKAELRLDYSHIGLITLTNQLTASLLQPFVGAFTDKHPQPFSLALGMASTLVGLVLLSVAPNLALVLVAVAFVGIGSSVFHPEASRVAHLSSGCLAHHRAAKRRAALHRETGLTRTRVIFSLGILIVLVFSKYFYLASMSSYYTFFLIEKFSLSVRDAQLHLFIFLAAIAAGTFLGGPVGDRIGRKAVIWVSILGVAPFALALPYANLFWCAVLSAIVGLILASAFSAILVYSQELVPGKVGTMSGLFFGLAFGLGGIGSALLGAMADRYGIPFVFHVCSYLPLIGLFTALLPNLGTPRRAASTAATA